MTSLVKPGTLLRIAAIYTALAGLAFIFAPRQIGAGAVPEDASAELIAYLRLFGSPLLGIAALDWLARDAEPSPARNAILIGNAVGFTALAALDVWGLLSGARPLTFGFAAIHVLFAVAFITTAVRNVAGNP